VVINLFRLNLMSGSVLHRVKIVAAWIAGFFTPLVIAFTNLKNEQNAILFDPRKLFMILWNRFPI